MPNIRLIAVGKVKTPFWIDAVEHYQKRTNYTHNLEIISVKDGDSKLPPEKRMAQEGESLRKLFTHIDTIICLDEKGKEQTSVDFAKFMQKIWDNGKTPCFVIGGAFGLCPIIKNSAQHLLALGKMTMPHELARVVLCEQLYRATTILAGTGYHHI